MMPFAQDREILSRRGFLRASAPPLALAGAGVPPLAFAAVAAPAPVARAVDAYHLARRRLDEGQARHDREIDALGPSPWPGPYSDADYALVRESEARLDALRDELLRAEASLIRAILGVPAPDAECRFYPTRGAVHAGRLYLATARDQDAAETFEPGQRDEGGYWVMRLVVVDLAAIAGPDRN